jgi:quercetin dioxygenase-like cupin family protein
MHRQSFAILALSLAMVAAAARAEEPMAQTIRSQDVKRTASPTGAVAAFILNKPGQPGLYAISALYPAGTKGTPHSHPDARLVTVISGTFYAGSGPTFDESKAQRLTVGDSIVIPAHALHWGWAKDGDALTEEVGVGPTTNVFATTDGK